MHPLAKLAALAKSYPLKKDLSKHLKGEDLATAWKIGQIQQQRHKQRHTLMIGHCNYGTYSGADYYLQTRALITPGEPAWKQHEDRAAMLNPAYRDRAQIWPMASHFHGNYIWKQSKALQRDWPYRWQDKQYSIHIHHDHENDLEVKGSRGASSYTTFDVKLRFNCYTHEAVVIGGLVTLRSKEDRTKDSYPCHWLERLPNGPGLKLMKGQIQNGDYHEPSADCFPQKTPAGRANALLRWQEDRLTEKTQAHLKTSPSTPPPASPWVTFQDSIAAGNCAAGTRSYIENRLLAFIRRTGAAVKNLTGCAVHVSLLQEAHKADPDPYLAKVLKHIRRRQQAA